MTDNNILTFVITLFVVGIPFAGTIAAIVLKDTPANDKLAFRTTGWYIFYLVLGVIFCLEAAAFLLVAFIWLMFQVFGR